MLKLMGAVLIFGACASLGLSARQGLRQRVSSADAMLLALALIEGEIASRRTPVPEIVGQLSESDNAAIRTVFGALYRRLLMADGLSLGYHWRAALRETRDEVGLDRDACDILCEAAAWLGRYDAGEQIAGLRQIARRLRAARDAAAGELQNKGNLYRTCGVALGLLVVLVLI